MEEINIHQDIIHFISNDLANHYKIIPKKIENHLKDINRIFFDELFEGGRTPISAKANQNDILDKIYKEIYDKQQPLLKQYDLTRCIALENGVTLAIADMEYNGVGFNPEPWKELAKDMEIE